MTITITAAKSIAMRLAEIDPGTPGPEWATVDQMLKENPGLFGGSKHKLYIQLDTLIEKGEMKKRLYNNKMHYAWVVPPK